MEWTQKEREVLQQLQEVERVSIKRYEKDEEHASDPKLKKLFARIRRQEEEHLKTLEELERGSIPMMTGGNRQGGESGVCLVQGDGEEDFFCRDGLESEKFASSQYDRAIFEFRDSSVGEILRHIQKEEQEHGRLLAGYIGK